MTYDHTTAVAKFHVGALRAFILSRIIEMDMLIAINVTAAYGYSVIAFALTDSGHVLTQGAIFGSSTLLTTLILFSSLISIVARVKAFVAVSMKSMQAKWHY